MAKPPIRSVPSAVLLHEQGMSNYGAFSVSTNSVTSIGLERPTDRPAADDEIRCSVCGAQVRLLVFSAERTAARRLAWWVAVLGCVVITVGTWWLVTTGHLPFQFTPDTNIAVVLVSMFPFLFGMLGVPLLLGPVLTRLSNEDGVRFQTWRNAISGRSGGHKIRLVKDGWVR